MAYKYKLPDNSYVYEGQQFSIGSGVNEITYPSNWLALASNQDLAEHEIIKEEIIIPPFVPTPDDIVRAQESKILAALTHMEGVLELSTVQVPIESANNANRPFGCDQTTQDNIVGVNVAIAVNIPVSDPTYWTPKGYPFPILVTHAELANIGGAILNKKNELYQVYFTHKAAIMMTSDYNEIMTYNVTTGYD